MGRSKSKSKHPIFMQHAYMVAGGEGTLARHGSEKMHIGIIRELAVQLADQ